MKITDEYVFFYKDWLSNYQRTSFVANIDDILGKTDGLMKELFTSTEQGFMFIKALYFNDLKTASKIIKTNNPAECRKLGRQVKGYNDEAWDKIRYDVFYYLNLEKYKQDRQLQYLLLDKKFDHKIFVEASPIDRIWGVGYAEDDDRIEYREFDWGRNYLGKIITNIRNRILLNKLEDPNWNIYNYWGKGDESDR